MTESHRGEDVARFARFLRSYHARPLPTETTPPVTTINSFAFIFDINAFTRAVSESDRITIAQLIRDILVGSTYAVETAGGEVVAFMGDAFLALLPTAEAVVNACFRAARDTPRRNPQQKRHGENLPAQERARGITKENP